ncbi:glycoside hydrolase [Heliocybe sulcata]|uniref:Glycoside hydrolase n=1 Tax=Heliocybe sulcata TaxID=5364 RepID=A0A5C3NEG3_9AGAM|nr:glycoside hydrolase [Heliocybe sulcata]
MAPVKLLNLLAISSLAIVACTFGATPANALATEHYQFARHAAHGHEGLARRKRDSAASKRCKARPSSSAAPAPSSSSYEAPSSAPAATTPAPAPSQPASSSQAPAPSTSVVSSGNTGSGKIGLAWPNGGDDSLKNYKTDKTKWLYTWSPDIPDEARSLGFEVVPMLWGENQVSEFSQKVVKGYANYVLGFNEPDQSGQSNMTPQRAADLWKQYIDPLQYQGYKLISPAVTSAPYGKTWMQQFFAACDSCHFDALAMHWYDVSADAFIKYVEDFHNTFNLPIWVTEYACQNFNGGAQCSDSDIASFMGQTTSFMNNADYVQAYMWFGAMHDMQGVNQGNQLMASSGAPTNLGYQFINA